MNIKYRKSLLAGVIATLMASPGLLAAEQMQAPQPDSERHGQQMGDSPAPSGKPIQSEPSSVEPAMNPAAGTTQGDDTLLSALTPQHLKKMDVVGASGEKIGKVEDVVRSREDGLIYAVVSSGGILGIGAKEIPVSLQELQVYGDKLRIGTTEDDLRSWAEYQKDQYVDLKPANQPISEFAAFEVTPPEGAGRVPEPNPPRKQ
jgi:sporulation protein YlmC with PRC-barrel domain